MSMKIFDIGAAVVIFCLLVLLFAIFVFELNIMVTYVFPAFAIKASSDVLIVSGIILIVTSSFISISRRLRN